MSSTTENLGLTLPAGSEWADVDVLNENWEKIDAAVLRAIAAAAAYDAGATYQQGDFCTQGGLLYRANQAIAQPEAWTAGHWTAISITDVIRGLTAADVGAYTKEEISSLLLNKAEATDLTAHTGNKSNPHGVTAAQVGAVSKTITNVTSADDLLTQASGNPGVKFFTDWADATPNKYGSGVIIESLDARNNVILYRGGDHFYTGRLADGAIVWKGPYIYGTSGTAAMTAGTSSLATGEYYNQYE